MYEGVLDNNVFKFQVGRRDLSIISTPSRMHPFSSAIFVPWTNHESCDGLFAALACRKSWKRREREKRRKRSHPRQTEPCRRSCSSCSRSSIGVVRFVVGGQIVGLDGVREVHQVPGHGQLVRARGDQHETQEQEGSDQRS